MSQRTGLLNGDAASPSDGGLAGGLIYFLVMMVVARDKAFCCGVIAIVIIMVELKAPRGATFDPPVPLRPVFMS